jgi:hypothetical protein
MKTRTLSKIIRLSCAVGVLTAAAVQATPITYTYTGTPFTTVTGPYTTSDKVTGSVELMNPLGPNMSLTFVTPLAFSFFDGVQTINSSSFTFANMSFATGPTGAITQWIVQVGTNTGIIQTANSIAAFDSGRLLPDGTGSGLVVFQPNPGTWSTTSVPDAGTTFGLLSLSVTALGVATRQFKRAAARPRQESAI